MKMIKKINAIILTAAIVFVTTFTLTTTSQATEYWPDSTSIESEAACVIDVDTGTILYENNADVQHYPASITKIMTVMLALENCKLDEIVTFSEAAVANNESSSSSHIAREVGEEMTLEDCLYAIMLASANEVAWAVGEHVGGTIEEFVNMMNEKAAELGCTGTHFANPNGLHDVDHYVTAHDMALIAQAAFSIPEFQKICSTTAYTLPADNKKEEYYLNNTHAMISASSTSQYLYDYAIGGKTGYTSEAGYTLVTFVEKDGMTLAVVILSGTNESRYNDTRTLSEYCFQNFTHFKVSEYVSISELNDTAATGVLSDKIDLIGIDTDSVIVLPNTASFVEATPTVSPSDEAGYVATITYTYAGKTVGSANIFYLSNDTISYPFNNLDVADGGSDLEYIRIDFKMIFLVIVAILAAIALIFFIHLQSSRILLSIHRSQSARNKKKNNKYRTINRRRRRKRRAAKKRSSGGSGGMRTRANAEKTNQNSTRSYREVKSSRRRKR